MAELTGPSQRLRRTRDNPHIRELTRAVRLHREQFIQPLFVVEGLREREAVPGLTNVHRETAASLLRQIEADLEQGISKFLLFGVPADRGRTGSSPTPSRRRGSPTSAPASATPCGWRPTSACAPTRHTATAAS